MKKKVDEKGIVYLEQPKIPTLSLAISLFSLLLISLGTLSIFAIQTPLQQSQDSTSKAAIQNGPVIISSERSPNLLSIRQLNTIDLLINTAGIQTQGTTMIFNVVTNTADVINVDTVSTSNLRATSQEVQKTSDGFLVKVVAVPAGTGPFSTTTATRFLRITFNPHNAGLFRLAFDQDYSHVYRANSSEEILGKIPQMDFTVLADKGNSCNHTCSSNDDCAVNLRCYNGTCRSVTNLSSDTCAISTVVTQVACNQGCANSSQCTNGNTCFENRCRAPGNPDSTVCASVTNTSYTTIIKACNIACSSNKECAVNLRCYGGACRLASNPSSSSCTPSNVASVSSIYTTSNTGSSTKGEEILLPTPKATASGAVKPTASPFVWPTPVPATGAAVITVPTPKPIVVTPSPAANSTFLSRLRQQSSIQNLSFPLIAVVAGVVLLIIALLLLLTRGQRTPHQLPQVQTPSPMNSRPPTTQEQSLEQRIADLKSAQTQEKSQMTMSPVTLPRPAQPVPATPIPMKTEPDQKPIEKETFTVPPSTLSIQPTEATAAPASQNSGTMMDRLKNKGVMDKMPNPTEPDQGNK